MPDDDLIDVTVWILVDADGRAVADCNPEVLRDEYHCDIGDLDMSRANRLYSVVVRVPRPQPVRLGVVSVVEVLVRADDGRVRHITATLRRVGTTRADWMACENR